jgi:hypothetical protein
VALEGAAVRAAPLVLAETAAPAPVEEPAAMLAAVVRRVPRAAPARAAPRARSTEVSVRRVIAVVVAVRADAPSAPATRSAPATPNAPARARCAAARRRSPHPGSASTLASASAADRRIRVDGAGLRPAESSREVQGTLPGFLSDRSASVAGRQAVGALDQPRAVPAGGRTAAELIGCADLAHGHPDDRPTRFEEAGRPLQRRAT